MVRRILVLGGARSGKSGFAERLAAECGADVLYVATATADDAEMADRIARHRAHRPPAWQTVEVRIGVAAALRDLLPRGSDPPVVLVEDLTLLLANLMATTDANDPSAAGAAGVDEAEASAVHEVDALVSLPAHTILVSNEVGMGIVPPYPLGRAFRDALGRVNQHAAAVCAEAYLVVAGVPLRLK